MGNIEKEKVETSNRVVVSTVFTGLDNSYINEVKLKTHHKPKRKKRCFLCKSQSNSLILILGVYFTIFLVASVLLMSSVTRLQFFNETNQSCNSFIDNEKIYDSHSSAITNEMNVVLERRDYKQFKWPYKSSSFDCSDLSKVNKFVYLTSGWTKSVFSFELTGKKYALKSVNIHGESIKNCLEKETMKLCLRKASSKMQKEYILSKELLHDNIVKVLAWCVSGDSFAYNVAIVTELCVPIDTVSLLRMSFEQRLKIMYDLSHLNEYLAHSPLGSVAINDFQRQQFVLCGNTLKLTDLDDLSTEEPKCSKSKHCRQTKLFQYLIKNHNYTHTLKCISNICLGYNEIQNVVNTYRHFVNLFLNINTPTALLQNVESLLNSYTSTWSAKSVLHETKLLFLKFRNLNVSGVYKFNI